MSNSTITNNDLGNVILENAQHRDDELTVGGAGTTPSGTILARDSATLKLIPFVKGGAVNDNGIPKAVLTYDVVADGAGDIPVRAGVSGEYRKERLIIAADGDASNVDSVVIDQLRDYGLVAIDVQELNGLDNQ